jgi:hypothetical protein
MTGKSKSLFKVNADGASSDHSDATLYERMRARCCPPRNRLYRFPARNCFPPPRRKHAPAPPDPPHSLYRFELGPDTLPEALFKLNERVLATSAVLGEVG